ncbi:MAG: LysR family transcriptional regulator [Raoultibacter sp.]
MNENQMRSFIAAVEKGSFSKAAKADYLSVPSFQQRINTLEGEIGYRILERSPYGVQPTEAGKHLYEAMKQALALLDAAKDRGRMCAENGPAEKISVGVWWQVSPFFKEVMETFISDNSNVWVDFVETNPDKMIEGFSHHQFDLCFLIQSKRLDASGLRFIPLSNEKMSIGVSPQIPLANEKIITMDMLNDITVYAGTDNRDTVGLEAFESFFAQNNVVKKTIFFEKLIMDCLQGKAVCFVGETSFERFSPPLVIRPTNLPSTKWGAYVHPDATETVEALVEACIKHAAANSKL